MLFSNLKKKVAGSPKEPPAKRKAKFRLFVQSRIITVTVRGIATKRILDHVRVGVQFLLGNGEHPVERFWIREVAVVGSQDTPWREYAQSPDEDV